MHNKIIITVYWWIFHCEYLLLTHLIWLGKYKTYISFLICKELWIYSVLLYQMNMHAKTVLCVIINLLYLNIPDDKWLGPYTIIKYCTQKDLLFKPIIDGSVIIPLLTWYSWPIYYFLHMYKVYTLSSMKLFILGRKFYFVT